MLRLLVPLVVIVAVWAFMVGWAVMYAFADTSHAGNVSGIVLSPVILVPLPGMIVLYALVFWCFVSVLTLFRHAVTCRHAARGLLLMHWMGAIFMLGRDLLSEGGAANIARAFGSYPSLSLFVVTYGFTQYYLCIRLGAEDQDVRQTVVASDGARLTAGRPWKW